MQDSLGVSSFCSVGQHRENGLIINFTFHEIFGLELKMSLDLLRSTFGKVIWDKM